MQETRRTQIFELSTNNKSGRVALNWSISAIKVCCYRINKMHTTSITKLKVRTKLEFPSMVAKVGHRRSRNLRLSLFYPKLQTDQFNHTNQQSLTLIVNSYNISWHIKNLRNMLKKLSRKKISFCLNRTYRHNYLMVTDMTLKMKKRIKSGHRLRRIPISLELQEKAMAETPKCLISNLHGSRT